MTRAQEAVLEALRRLCEDGWPASVREVAAEAGIASPGTVHDALVDLEQLGLAQTNPRQASRRGGWKPIDIRTAEENRRVLLKLRDLDGG